MLRHTENSQNQAAPEAGKADVVDPAPDEPEVDGALGVDTAARLDEAILGGARRYTLSELIERTGLSQEFIESYWRWMGLPVTHPTERWFTDADEIALREIAELFETEQMDHRAQMTFVRSMGHTTERLALWQVEALVEHFARRHELDDASARLLALDQLPPLAETLGRQLEHAWRRQLAALTGRMAIEFAGARAGEPTDSHQLPLPRAVGFADIVSFTKRTAGLGSAELAEFVQRFEAGARDVITTAGGRVVKTIGDAVLFVADDVTTGAEVALGLAESTARALGTAGPEDAEIPVRVGFVWGRVLSRFGDVFGPSVNLASRLTELAEPSSVLVDTSTATQLATSSRYALTAQPEQDVPGIGPLVPVRLQRAYAG
ncbi:adenylate/guanylate cyclase domain-containing protein [Antribacter sp. KLBMP9083]|uniref:Adenylate/guanylate cyclase domain-containing protein n=1 Tax=Antribacter soli TaxID=2910976 RepID=A0AA41QB17_9MICO|nr:adenylate/guanylate cyclase domain-containing protein [Antribacter soli]MCF4119831.1 adenylate/guanylate cyclase domain-containing protein [Antribacter soli]